MKQKSSQRAEFNRRTFLSSLAAASALTTLNPRLALASAPIRGGHVRYGVRGGSTTDTLDPGTFSHAFVRTMGYGYSNTLVEIDGNNQLQPELLESWEALPGAQTWIFKLKSGITFHDGKSFNADDVIATIQHHIRPDSTSGARALLAPIVAMKREDDLTVRFELATGNSDFPAVFSDYRMMIMASKDGVADTTSGNGTGGYILRSFEPGVRASLERNPNYWRSDRAFFESADIVSMSDTTARQNALMTGGVDIIDQVDLKTVHLLQRSKDVSVQKTTGGQHYVYAMNTTLDTFTSNDMRLALKYGIDREALLQKVLRGFGQIGNDHPIASSMTYHAADIEQHSYDPDRAKHHLKKAGMDAVSLSLSVADGLYPGSVDGVTLYREQLASTGIDLEIDRVPTDGFWTNVWMKKSFVAGLWGTRATADMILSTAYESTAKWNETFWQNGKFDQMLVAARTELDQSKRAALYREMQILLRDEGGAVIPLFADNVFAMNNRVSHPEGMSGAWELDGGRSLERWWFNSAA